MSAQDPGSSRASEAGGEPILGDALADEAIERETATLDEELEAALAGPAEARAAIAAMASQRDDYLDSLRRLQADFENYKKRVARQQVDQVERAAQGLVDKLLPVLDTADLAISHGGGDEVTQLRATLVAALEREGLERIDPVGEPFDPNVADAVAHEPGEGEATVAEVLRAGYRWKGRVLRPAMVKVRG
jgi:molecular chaperone GrpE